MTYNNRADERISMERKVVLITGSARGIGEAIAYEFAREKATAVVTYYRDRSRAEQTYNKCLALGSSDGLLVALNVMSEESIRRCVGTVVATFGRIDVLVNNAGTLTWTYLRDQSYDDIKNQIRTNLEGAIMMTKACLPHVTETIINIGSIAGMNPLEELTVCCATKFGLRGFTQALAKEAPELNIYSVNPDYIATRMTDFVGRSPEEVARVVVNAAKGVYALPSGSDINVWETPRSGEEDDAVH
ncbi:MAG: SDR family oxidoreductase [Euryarchaeota archaeon]|nr:SDR family oxidoreductase [Euryarchaeota archaeon]